jgi:membrane protease YdiL (CAAX protease family)
MTLQIPTSFLHAGHADRGSPLRYLVGVAVAVGTFLAGMALLSLLPAQVQEDWLALHLFVYLLPVAAVLGATRFLHGRPMRSVLGPWPRLRPLVLTALAGFASIAVFTALISQGAPDAGLMFTDPAIARLSAVILGGYLAQVLAEEVLFRG